MGPHQILHRSSSPRMTWVHWLELIFAKQLRTVPRVTRVVVGDTRLVYYEPQDQTPASGAKAEWVQTSLFQGGFEGIGLDEAVRGAIDGAVAKLGHGGGSHHAS